MHVIAIANQKGGVGKTTTTHNVGVALSTMGKRCLLIDSDPQGHLTKGLGIDARTLEKTTLDALKGEKIQNLIVPISPTLDLIGSNRTLAEAEHIFLTKMSRPRLLERALKPINGQYDFVLIDCPPQLGTLVHNALTAAQYVLVPVQGAYYSLDGMTDLLDTIDDVKINTNENLKILGFVLTMFNKQRQLDRDVYKAIREAMPEAVFETRIDYRTKIAEAPSHGKSIMEYEPKSEGALQFNALACEIIRRCN